MSYEKIERYNVYLDGPNGGVPSFDSMRVTLKTNRGYHDYAYSCQTEQAFEKISMVIDLLRNEKNVYYNPSTNTLLVNYEEAGEKDQP